MLLFPAQAVDLDREVFFDLAALVRRRLLELSGVILLRMDRSTSVSLSSFSSLVRLRDGRPDPEPRGWLEFDLRSSTTATAGGGGTAANWPVWLLVSG